MHRCDFQPCLARRRSPPSQRFNWKVAICHTWASHKHKHQTLFYISGVRRHPGFHLFFFSSPSAASNLITDGRGARDVRQRFKDTLCSNSARRVRTLEQCAFHVFWWLEPVAVASASAAEEKLKSLRNKKKKRRYHHSIIRVSKRKRVSNGVIPNSNQS